MNGTGLERAMTTPIPCPFCGETQGFMVTWAEIEDDAMLLCPHCGACGPSVKASPVNVEEDRENATVAWNRRAMFREAVEKRDAEWMEADRIATSRHARELERAKLEAKIELFDEFVLCECGEPEDGFCGPCKQRAAFRAALAALDVSRREGA